MKIVDCFTFYNELDMLKFRLEYLYDMVDHFVLVEATLTHTGNPKPLFFEINKPLFSKYLDKIVHIVVRDLKTNSIIRSLKTDVVNKNWNREKHQRYCIQLGINKLNLQDNDRILISDLDEIPNKHILKNTYGSGVYALEQELYYYTLNYKSNESWTMSRLIDYSTYKQNPNPQFIRSKMLDIPKIKNAGWHFSYFGDINFIVNKIRNFCHADWFESLTYDEIKEKISKGQVLLDSYQFHTFSFVPVTENPNLPEGYEKLITTT